MFKILESLGDISPTMSHVLAVLRGSTPEHLHAVFKTLDSIGKISLTMKDFEFIVRLKEPKNFTDIFLRLREEGIAITEAIFQNVKWLPRPEFLVDSLGFLKSAEISLSEPRLPSNFLNVLLNPDAYEHLYLYLYRLSESKILNVDNLVWGFDDLKNRAFIVDYLARQQQFSPSILESLIGHAKTFELQTLLLGLRKLRVILTPKLVKQIFAHQNLVELVKILSFFSNTLHLPETVISRLFHQLLSCPDLTLLEPVMALVKTSKNLQNETFLSFVLTVETSKLEGLSALLKILNTNPGFSKLSLLDQIRQFKDLECLPRVLDLAQHLKVDVREIELFRKIKDCSNLQAVVEIGENFSTRVRVDHVGVCNKKIFIELLSHPYLKQIAQRFKSCPTAQKMTLSDVYAELQALREVPPPALLEQDLRHKKAELPLSMVAEVKGQGRSVGVFRPEIKPASPDPIDAAEAPPAKRGRMDDMDDSVPPLAFL